MSDGISENVGNTAPEITGVILAGGLGTRLRSVVADRPKVMAEVGGKPFLSYLLQQLADNGIQQTVICTGYRAGQIEEYYGASFSSMKLSYSREDTPLGTAGALRLAQPLLTAPELLVLNGDSCCICDLAAFCRWHREKQSLGSVLLAPLDDTSRYGRVEVSERGEILRFEEKRPASGPGWINAGIYLFSRALLDAIEPGKNISLEKEVFPELVGRSFYGYRIQNNCFIDIGTPESFQLAQRLVPAAFDRSG